MAHFEPASHSEMYRRRTPRPAMAIAVPVGLTAWIAGVIPPTLIGWSVNSALRVVFCLAAVFVWIVLINDARREMKRKPESMAGADAPTAYAVPRRFGLATMLVVTFAFALLFTALNWLEIPPVGSVIVTSMLALVGALQMVFDRVPRTASAVVGGVFYPLVLLVSLLVYSPRTLGSLFFLGPIDLAYTLLSHVVIGEFLGYLAGVLVAGVFLVEDYVARSVRGPRREHP